MAKQCKICNGTGKLGLPPEDCHYCDGTGYIKEVPKECYEKFGLDLDGCSTQEEEGCGRCPLYK